MAVQSFAWPSEEPQWKAYIASLEEPYEQVNHIGQTIIYTGDSIAELELIRSPINYGVSNDPE
jgi:hypothetical protein